MNISEKIFEWNRSKDSAHLLILCTLIARCKDNVVEFSTRKLETETGVSRQKIRTILEHMESDGIITQQATQQLTHLTFCKYACNGKEITQKATQQPTQVTTIQKTSYGTVKLTDEEYQKIGEKVGLENVPRVIEILDNYKRSSGKTYKSDYHAILTWVITRYEEELKRLTQAYGQQQQPRQSAFEQANNEALMKMMR